MRAVSGFANVFEWLTCERPVTLTWLSWSQESNRSSFTEMVKDRSNPPTAIALTLNRTSGTFFEIRSKDITVRDRLCRSVFPPTVT